MSEQNKPAKLINSSELSFAKDTFMNAKQLGMLLKQTPTKYVRERPAKGGGTWKYVSGGYVRKCLNIMFGWDWDFEILEQMVLNGEAIVKGKLTVRSNGRTITKMQFGNKDVIYRKLQQGETERQPLSIGNDMKAAATDALKKCAAELGIASDIYNKEEFEAINVNDDTIQFSDLAELYELKKEECTETERTNFERILNNNEEDKFKSVYKTLKNK